MPSRPARPCRVRSCPNKVKGRVAYCPRHRHMAPSLNKKETDPWYNLSLTKARQLGFVNNWKGNPNLPLRDRGGLRAQQLLRQPYCEECKKHGIINDVTGKGEGEVDHIVPFRTGETTEIQMKLFQDHNNHKTLCNHHHRIKTGKQRKDRKQ